MALLVFRLMKQMFHSCFFFSQGIAVKKNEKQENTMKFIYGVIAFATFLLSMAQASETCETQIRAAAMRADMRIQNDSRSCQTDELNLENFGQSDLVGSVRVICSTLAVDYRFRVERESCEVLSLEEARSDSMGMLNQSESTFGQSLTGQYCDPTVFVCRHCTCNEAGSAHCSSWPAHCK